jgi:hypothetical protein
MSLASSHLFSLDGWVLVDPNQYEAPSSEVSMSEQLWQAKLGPGRPDEGVQIHHLFLQRKGPHTNMRPLPLKKQMMDLNTFVGPTRPQLGLPQLLRHPGARVLVEQRPVH